MGLPLDGYGLLAVTETPPSLLQAFSCGKPHLDAFLAETAPFFHRAKLGLTSVVMHAQVPNEVLGYFTVPKTIDKHSTPQNGTSVRTSTEQCC